jgi:hypothetical protein
MKPPSDSEVPPCEVDAQKEWTSLFDTFSGMTRSRHSGLFRRQVTPTLGTAPLIGPPDSRGGYTHGTAGFMTAALVGQPHSPDDHTRRTAGFNGRIHRIHRTATLVRQPHSPDDHSLRTAALAGRLDSWTDQLLDCRATKATRTVETGWTARTRWPSWRRIHGSVAPAGSRTLPLTILDTEHARRPAMLSESHWAQPTDVSIGYRSSTLKYSQCALSGLERRLRGHALHRVRTAMQQRCTFPDMTSA